MAEEGFTVCLHLEFACVGLRVWGLNTFTMTGGGPREAFAHAREASWLVAHWRRGAGCVSYRTKIGGGGEVTEEERYRCLWVDRRDEKEKGSVRGGCGGWSQGSTPTWVSGEDEMRG